MGSVMGVRRRVIVRRRGMTMGVMDWRRIIANMMARRDRDIRTPVGFTKWVVISRRLERPMRRHLDIQKG
jgi:hypothetical protein